MFKRSNFCHVASNNRNNVKSGVFIYRTTDNLATVSANGYFNDMIIDINLHDLIIHEQIDASDSTKVERNLLAVSAKSLDNINTVVVQSKWEKDIGEQLDGFVKIDGTSIMTAPLKFLAGSMRGAVGPYLNGVSFWKMDSQGNITNIANLTDSQFLPTTTNAIDIGRSANEWKDLYLSGKAYVGTINNGADITVPATGGTMALTGDIKDSTITISLNGLTQDSFTLNQDTPKTIDIAAANTDLSNLTATGKNISNWSSNVSNCTTEIPQDIKLELNNGTLTVKAGTVYYVPNGAGVFTKQTLASDATVSSASITNKQFFILFGPSGTVIRFPLSDCFSGPTAPTVDLAALWYDTTNNQIKHTTDSGATWTPGWSLPIAICTDGSSTWSSIDQIFNGFGYIGHHIFVFPNVSVSIPDGLNTDGSLKSIRRTNNALRVVELVNTTNNAIFITNYSDYVTRQTYGGAVDNISEITTEYSWYYVREENMYCRIVNGALQTTSMSKIIDFTYNGTIISDFKSKTVFRAVDYNDFEKVVDAVATNASDIATNASDIAAIIANTKSITAKDALNSIVTTTGISKGQDGYVKLGNGMIIQWGYVSSATSGSTITFPTAFSNTNYAITGSGIMDGDRFPNFYDRTTTNTKYKMYGGTSDISWIAIGY